MKQHNLLNLLQQPKRKKLSKAQLETLADTAARKGDLNGAVKYYGQLLFQAPSQLNYWKRSQLYMRQKKYDKVIEDLKKAVELDDKFLKGYVEMGKLNLLTGNCLDAEDNFKKSLEMKPNEKTALEKLPSASTCRVYVDAAEQSCSKSDWHHCKYYIDEAMKIAYDSVSLLLKRAEANYASGDYQSLLVDTRAVLKDHNKNDLNALHLRGKAYYRMGDHDTALAHYREALRLDPEHSKIKKSYNILRALKKATDSAQELQGEGKYAEAAEIYQKAIEIDDENKENICLLYIKKCEALHKSGAWEAGVAACTHAIDYDPKQIKAWMQRGEAKIRGEQYDDAIRDFKQAVQIDEHSQEAKEALHKAELELKKSKRKNYYKILGISNNANDKEIKRAYRKQALLWHPDRHKGEEAMKEAELKFREIGEAHEVLSDAEKRARYDRGEDVEVPQNQGHQGFHGFNGGQQFHFNFG